MISKEINKQIIKPLLSIKDIINFQLYPISYPQEYQELIKYCHNQFKTYGYCVFKNFLTPQALEILQQESELLAPHAYYAQRRTNPFKTEDDPSLPLDHPIRFFMDRTNAFVPTNRFETNSLFKILYHEPIFQQFLAACLEEKIIYEYDDPLAGLVLNILSNDAQHPWHYDENDFSIVLMIQPALIGGVFECVDSVRTPENENYQLVKKILHGEYEKVQSINLQPGDLQIFRGKNSLHRVTKVSGDTQRYTAIFSYTTKQRVIGTVKDTKLLFGEVTSEHRDGQTKANVSC
ncbi:MAG: hypothetical protein AAF378_16185 [Cyanobacteria bacterium P01_A01_bin.84]